MRHASTIAFVSAVAGLVAVSALLTTQVGKGTIGAFTSNTMEPEMVVYEQEVTTPDGEIVIVRTHAGEAPDEASLWALHQSRVDRVKAG